MRRSVLSLPFRAVLAAAGLALLLGIRPPVTSAQGGVTFFGVGDLPNGPVYSEVRDATRVGSTIYAVGGSAARAQTLCDANGAPAGCVGAYRADTAVLWTVNGTSVTPAALPNLVSNTTANTTLLASAITADAQYIAGRARSVTSGGAVQAVRVQTALVPFLSSLFNLSALPPALAANTFANAVSSNGSVLYGGSQALSRAVRFDIGANSNATIAPISPATGSSIAARGAAADGSVAVGSMTGGPTRRAFRYVHGTGASLLPLLDGGTWNSGEAVSPNGQLFLVAGNSPTAPMGEPYLFDTTTGTRTPLGSANTAWSPFLGGVQNFSVDASGTVDVVAGTFQGGLDGDSGYIRNARGWFTLGAVLGSQGIDTAALGWSSLTVFGLSADGTLIFGSGKHNGNVEGFVASFPAGFLKTFDVAATRPTNTGIVGVWAGGGTGTPDPANPTSVAAFLADGTYFQIEPSGFERGTYTYDTVSGRITFSTRVDTNGGGGLSGVNGRLALTASVSGNALTLTNTDPLCATDCSLQAARITGTPETITGGWVLGDPTQNDSSTVIVFTASGKYFMAEDSDPASNPGGVDGIEIGTVTWDGSTLANPVISTDTNGEWGLSHSTGAVAFVLGRDGLQADAGDATGTRTITRIVDPATVVPSITSPLAATGIATTPFSYAITSTFGLTFGVANAPAWLTVNADTGALSGTPTAAGTFNVTISATNTFGDSGEATLSIVIDPPNTSTGSGVAVTPDVPPGGEPVALTFSTVTQPGETTVTPIDPLAAPAAPSGFQVGPTLYNLSTTATFAGPVTVCFGYAGAAPGTTPRLFHYEGGAWVDITTSVDEASQTICGVTTSFSPFGVFLSPIVRTGFFAPVSPVPGFVNTVKGGSTVPLKFTVTVNGVPKTDTAGLQFSAAQVSCTASAEDPVDFVTTGATSLRYDATSQQFIQNWQTPRGAGVCYVVRMTTLADGLSLSASFKTR